MSSKLMLESNPLPPPLVHWLSEVSSIATRSGLKSETLLEALKGDFR
jgi:hypothetical protein